MNNDYREIDPNDLENVAGGAHWGPSAAQPASVGANMPGGSSKGARFRKFDQMSLAEMAAIRPTDADYRLLLEWLKLHPENPLAGSLNGGING